MKNLQKTPKALSGIKTPIAVARVLIEGKPTSAFICLINTIQESKQPNYLTVEQWQLAKALQEADDNKLF